MTALPVASSSNRSGASPLWARAAATTSTKSAWLNGWADTLTATVFGRACGVLLGLDLGQHHQELIAPLPAYRVLRAHARLEPDADFAQHLVAHVMSGHVVDVLEPVQVHEQDRQSGAGPLTMGDGDLESIGQQQAVGQVGQRIMLGHVGQAFVGAGALDRRVQGIDHALEEADVLAAEAAGFAWLGTEHADRRVAAAYQHVDAADHAMGQFFLKFVISHPAVTVATPATSQARHMIDNMGAAMDELPDPAMRQRMIAHVESL